MSDDGVSQILQCMSNDALFYYFFDVQLLIIHKESSQRKVVVANFKTIRIRAYDMFMLEALINKL